MNELTVEKFQNGVINSLNDDLFNENIYSLLIERKKKEIISSNNSKMYYKSLSNYDLLRDYVYTNYSCPNFNNKDYSSMRARSKENGPSILNKYWDYKSYLYIINIILFLLPLLMLLISIVDNPEIPKQWYLFMTFKIIVLLLLEFVVMVITKINTYSAYKDNNLAEEIKKDVDVCINQQLADYEKKIHSDFSLFYDDVIELYLDQKNDFITKLDDIKRDIKHLFINAKDKKDKELYNVNYQIQNINKLSTSISKEEIKELKDRLLEKKEMINNSEFSLSPEEQEVVDLINNNQTKLNLIGKNIKELRYKKHDYMNAIELYNQIQKTLSVKEEFDYIENHSRNRILSQARESLVDLGKNMEILIDKISTNNILESKDILLLQS